MYAEDDKFCPEILVREQIPQVTLCQHLERS
jgi:hypothetical protein